MNSERVLVCGSRDWRYVGIVRRMLVVLPAGTVIIHGDCPTGADAIADGIATSCGFAVERFPADWETYGKAAGPIRNQQMLERGKPDRVIAFALTNPPTGGTGNMVRQARDAKVPVLVITPPANP